MSEADKVRLDKYLWSIRLFKTRAQATEACDKGKVRFGGATVKAAKKVIIGDKYEVKMEAKKWVIKVSGLIQKRVQFSEAIKFYLDLTPSEEIEKNQFLAASYNTGKRQSKTGRPTKKQNRDLNEFYEDLGA